MNETPGARPAWVDDAVFPFESRFVDLDGSLVHYVDEGEGPVLLCYHGNPTWSFLYRDLISRLSHRFRCVAWDYPGFGLSTAAPGYGFTVAEHALVAERFVAALDLDGVTPVVQDWGGPIGLTAAARDPGRYRALVVGNTWAWPRTDPLTRAFSWSLGGPIGRRAVERWNVFAERLVPLGHRNRTLSDAELRHYTAPFPDAASRRPTWVFPREIRTALPLLREAERALPRLRELPTLLLWGQRDPAFREPDLQRWQRELTDTTVRRLDDAGHYWQDDAPEAAADAILDWWPQAGGPGVAGPAG